MIPRPPPFWLNDAAGFEGSSSPLGFQRVSNPDTDIWAIITANPSVTSASGLPAYSFQQIQFSDTGGFAADAYGLATAQGWAPPATCQLVGYAYDLAFRTTLALNTIIKVWASGYTDEAGYQEFNFGADTVLTVPATYQTGGLLYANTTVPSGNTIASTSTETAFASNYTFPANEASVQSMMRITLRGTYGTAASPPTGHLKIKFGSTQMVLTSDFTMVTDLSGAGWAAEAILDFQTIGATAAVETQFNMFFGTADAPNPAALPVFAPLLTPNTLDTTVDQLITVLWKWGTASASNTITLRQFVIEYLQIVPTSATASQVYGQANDLPAIPGYGPARTIDLNPASPAVGTNIATSIINDPANNRLKFLVDNLGLFWRRNGGTTIGPRRRANLLDSSQAVWTLTDIPGSDEVTISIQTASGSIPIASLVPGPDDSVLRSFGAATLWDTDPQVKSVTVGRGLGNDGFLQLQNATNSKDFNIDAKAITDIQDWHLPKAYPPSSQCLLGIQGPLAAPDVQMLWVVLSAYERAYVAQPHTAGGIVQPWGSIGFTSDLFFLRTDTLNGAPLQPLVDLKSGASNTLLWTDPGAVRPAWRSLFYAAQTTPGYDSSKLQLWNHPASPTDLAWSTPKSIFDSTGVAQWVLVPPTRMGGTYSIDSVSVQGMAGATTSQLQIYTLQPGQMAVSAIIKTVVAFSGVNITSLTLNVLAPGGTAAMPSTSGSVQLASIDGTLAASSDNFNSQSQYLGPSTVAATTGDGMDFAASTVCWVTSQAFGGGLLSALATGSAQIWLLIAKLPTPYS